MPSKDDPATAGVVIEGAVALRLGKRGIQKPLRGKQLIST